jgi:ribosomal protein S21
MIKVTVRNNNLDGALRTLKQKTLKSGIQKKAREREEGYMKPGVKRRMAKKEAIKNSHRNERRDRERY